MRRTLPLLIAIAAVGGLIAAFGCSDSTAPAPGGDMGRLQLTLIDARADADTVMVDVVGVEVHRAGDDSSAGWFSVRDDTFMVDLLTLTDGNGLVLTDTMVPAGYYTQIRLLLGDRSYVVVEGEKFPLEIPSGATSGLKLNHPFTIEAGSIYGATLDFDAYRSIHRTGNHRWILRPVIRVCVDAISGGLRGIVYPDSAATEVWAVSGADSARAGVDAGTGAFRFPMLLRGLYDVTVVAADTAYRDTTLSGVEVMVGAVTDLDTIRVPLAE